MKKEISSLVIIVLICISTSSFGQDNAGADVIPNWVSKKGFWVVESNLSTPDACVIFFYNKEGTLIYKEQLEGIKLNLKKKKGIAPLKKCFGTNECKLGKTTTCNSL